MADVHPNDDTQDTPLFLLQSLVETFGHWTKWNSQSKFKKRVPIVVKPSNNSLWTYMISPEINETLIYRQMTIYYKYK